jgi:hypothetical protein
MRLRPLEKNMLAAYRKRKKTDVLVVRSQAPALFIARFCHVICPAIRAIVVPEAKTTRQKRV